MSAPRSLASSRRAGPSAALGMPRSGRAEQRRSWHSMLVFGGGIALSTVPLARAGGTLRLAASVRDRRPRDTPRWHSGREAITVQSDRQPASPRSRRRRGRWSRRRRARAQGERERESLLDCRAAARGATAEQARAAPCSCCRRQLDGSSRIRSGSSALTTIATSIVPDIADLCRIGLLQRRRRARACWRRSHRARPEAGRWRSPAGIRARRRNFSRCAGNVPRGRSRPAGTLKVNAASAAPRSPRKSGSRQPAGVRSRRRPARRRHAAGRARSH